MPTLLAGAQHAAKRLKPGGREIAVSDSSVQRALRRCVIVTTTARTVFSDRLQVGEGGDDPITADVAEAEGAYAGGVDNPALLGG